MQVLCIKQLILCTLLVIWSLAHHSLAQQNYTVSGTVKEKSSGETLTGATITCSGKARCRRTTNEYGFYSLSLPKGKYTLRYFIMWDANRN